jgi:hypothetical protein
MEPKAIAASSARATQGERANRTALNQLQMKCLGRLCKSASKRCLLLLTLTELATPRRFRMCSPRASVMLMWIHASRSRRASRQGSQTATTPFQEGPATRAALATGRSELRCDFAFQRLAKAFVKCNRSCDRTIPDGCALLMPEAVWLQSRWLSITTFRVCNIPEMKTAIGLTTATRRLW